MSNRRQRVAAGTTAYEIVVGVVLLVFGLRSHAWWTGILGLGMIVLGLATGFGRGETTSWMRGELDERRSRAVDHAFRIAFFALAWWIAGVAVYAERHVVGTQLWVAGTAVAVVAAYVDYALVLRRT